MMHYIWNSQDNAQCTYVYNDLTAFWVILFCCTMVLCTFEIIDWNVLKCLELSKFAYEELADNEEDVLIILN